MESLGHVDNCSDQGSDPSFSASFYPFNSTFPPSRIPPHLYCTLSTLPTPNLVAHSVPLIAPSIPSHVACSHSNYPTAHTSHSPLGSGTSDRGCGRRCGRGHGRGRYRTSHSGSPPLITFSNVPYSFSNPPPFMISPRAVAAIITSLQ